MLKTVFVVPIDMGILMSKFQNRVLPVDMGNVMSINRGPQIF